MKIDNLENMKKCPKFETCNINICPLDEDRKKRVELPEEDRCPLFRLQGERKTKRIKMRLSATMRGLAGNIRGK